MERWAVVLPVVLGLAAGIGGYAFRYAKGLSYFSPDPNACVNCHIMQPQFDAWQKSSHHAVAVCVECHLPQEFFAKYFVKAENGLRHAHRFTTQDFVEPIRVQAMGQRVLQANCERCHDALVHDLAQGPRGDADKLSCVHCHAGVGHGERSGLGGPLPKLSDVASDNLR